MSWQDLLNSANLTIDELKSRLPLEWVVAEAGVALERRSDGRLVGICPFHLDSNPSFAVFGDNLDRVGCWSCDFTNGDLLDFIQRWKSCGFNEALTEAVRLLKRFEETRNEWQPAPPPDRVIPDPEQLQERARAAWQLAESDLSPIARFIQDKGLPLTARWLHDEFMVGALDEYTILIPHAVETDSGLTVTGYKTRTPTSHPYAAAGSRFIDLYGSWRDRGRAQVIICEGESDTWLLAHLFPDYDVFGLPAGANQPPKSEWVDRFRKRDIVILTDADTPGRQAAKRWHEALAPISRSVRVASLEDGADPCSTVLDLHQVVADASEVPVWTGQVALAQSGDRYIRTNSGQPVCNWAIRPDRLIEMEEGGAAIGGVLVGTDERVVITGNDLISENYARRWSLRYGRVWLGTTKDAQALWEYLLQEGPFLAHGSGTYVAGWHDGHVVLPNRTLGPRHWLYVTPPTEPGVERLIDEWHDTTVDDARRALLAGLTLHRPEIISPIIAWLAVAPVRALFPVFPPLAVVGPAGSGKTTLLSELLRLFGWSGNEHNLTSSTPYGVAALVTSTNGVPVWFDEYRHGCRRDTKETFEQALRDAWTASYSLRGGVYQQQASQLTAFRTTAPLIASGEDMFSETSHAERLIIIKVPYVGKNVEALRYLRLHRTNGIGPLYLAWLVEQHQAGTLPLVQVPEEDRPAQGQYALRYGWDLLSRFAGEVLQLELPMLELSAANQERENILSIPPILDAVSWALTETDRKGKPLAWVEGDDVIVRARALVSEIRRDEVVQLPGGERSVISWLRDYYKTAHERTNFGLALRLFGARHEIETLGVDPDDSE